MQIRYRENLIKLLLLYQAPPRLNLASIAGPPAFPKNAQQRVWCVGVQGGKIIDAHLMYPHISYTRCLCRGGQRGLPYSRPLLE